MKTDYWQEKSPACPACGGTDFHSSFRMLYWSEFPLCFHDCSKCGASFANPMPSDALIARGNDALVRLYQRGRRFEDEFRDARQAFLRGKLLGAKLARSRKVGRVLEIGCYDGFFLAGLRESSGWEAEGVEIAEAPSRFARDPLGLTIHQGTLESQTLGQNRYDYIICHDLIEHINRPREFLAEIARILKPGGRLQVITPNASQDLAFARRADRSGTPLPMLLNHVIYYRPRSLRIGLERVGLRIRKLYAYDLRHALKDYGVFAGSKAPKILPGPRLGDAEGEEIQDLRALWSPERLAELKSHPKVGRLYGFWRETLPACLRIRVPERLAIGHEIFALAEKP